MNKKIKSLVMAGLVSIMAGSAVVSSNALCKDNVTTTSKKGAIYIFVNGKKHVINLGGINKPSQDNNQNNTNIGNNNNQNNNNTNTGNNNQNNNNSNIGNNDKPNSNKPNNNKPNNNKPNNNQNNNINTDKDNKQGADTACNDKGSSGSDPGNMESIFQNDPAKIHTDNHNKYIEKSSQKIISGIFQETME